MADNASRPAALGGFFADALARRADWLAHRRASDDLGQDELIHEIRVTIKQFRAYLRLLSETTGDRFISRQDESLQNAARDLAANRDPLVIRQTLERLAARCQRVPSRHSLHRILLHLGDERPTSGRLTAIDSAVAGLVVSARAFSRRIRPKRSEGKLIDALVREYRHARKMTHQKRKKPAVESWHRWRKLVKAVHYQVGGLDGALPGKLRRFTAKAWKLQAMLGRHHDLFLARHRVRRLRIDPINEPCRDRTIKVIDREICRVEEKIGRFSRRLFELNPDQIRQRLERVRSKVRAGEFAEGDR